jgi:hypothetical protein
MNVDTILEPENDRLLSYPDVSRRWGVGVGIARKRCKLLNVPVIQWSATAVGIRLSDILKAEMKLMRSIE